MLARTRLISKSKMNVPLGCLLGIILFGGILLQTQGSIEPIQDYSDDENPVVAWNDLTTEFSLESKLSPPRLARAYSLVHVAMYDALLAARNQHLNGNSLENQKGIIAGAASEVLTYLFPDKNATLSEFMDSQTREEGNLNRSSLSLIPALQFGEAIGKQVVVNRYSRSLFCQVTGLPNRLNLSIIGEIIRLQRSGTIYSTVG